MGKEKRTKRLPRGTSTNISKTGGKGGQFIKVNCLDRSIGSTKR